MDKVVELNSVELYTRLYGLEYQHPLLAVIDLNKATQAVDYNCWNYGVYALYLKMEKTCSILYGRQTYDYQAGTIVCFAPGQTARIVPVAGQVQMNVLGILFHPDLLRGTPLGRSIQCYSYFSYTVNEALHISAAERDILINLFGMIQREMPYGTELQDKKLLVNYIELVLNYCMRFYERQFITRKRINNDVLARFENLLDNYLLEGDAEQKGLPTVKYFADKLCLSSNYFGDMLKKVTGKSPQEFIQEKVIMIAKERILSGKLSVSQVAYSLGFQYPQHLSRLFRAKVGCTPSEYRKSIQRVAD